MSSPCSARAPFPLPSLHTRDAGPSLGLFLPRPRLESDSSSSSLLLLLSPLYATNFAGFFSSIATTSNFLVSRLSYYCIRRSISPSSSPISAVFSSHSAHR